MKWNYNPGGSQRVRIGDAPLKCDYSLTTILAMTGAASVTRDPTINTAMMNLLIPPPPLPCL